jgi:hypothetical protein
VASALFLSALAAACSLPLAASLKPDLEISPRSELYPLLRRAQTRSDSLMPQQAFPQASGSLRPWMREETLFSGDRAWLEYGLPEKRRELIAWTSPERGNSLFVSPELEAGFTAGSRGDSSLDAGLGGFGLTLYGRLANHLSFYAHGLVYTEVTDRKQFTHQFDPNYGETYSVEKGEGDSLLGNRTYNRHVFYATYDMPWIRLKAGRDFLHSGPGYFSSLTAWRGAPPYYLVEARVEFSPWLHLEDYLIQMTDTDHAIRKYANLHRFEFLPFRNLSVGFQDIVIYQDKDPDPRYLLPLAPLTFTESDNGGLDNAAMGFDFLAVPVRNLSVWGELFVDDLLGPGAFFDDFWENRWAVLGGFQATSPWRGFDADLVIEYSQVEPWTYIGRQPQTSFKHFNMPSGSKLGPDSRSLDLQAAYRPMAGVELKVRWESDDKGLGRQATLGVVHDDAIDPSTKSLLGGAVAKRRVLTQEAAFLWRQLLLVRLSWAHGFGDQEENALRGSVSATW